MRCWPARRWAHQYYFKFILLTAEATEKGLQALDSKGSQEPMASVFCVTFSAPTRPPLPKVVETGYKVLASTTPGHGRPVQLQFLVQEWDNISFLPSARLQSGCTGWQLLLVQGQMIWPIPGG